MAIPTWGNCGPWLGGVPVGLDPMCNGTRNWMPKSRSRVVSINAFKGVEFGLGFDAGRLKGSRMDEIIWSCNTCHTRRTNNLWCFEGA